MSSEQIEGLVRFVRVLVRALVGEVVVGDYKNQTLHYYLDSSRRYKCLPTFNQKLPLFVHVKFTSFKQGPSFPVDMKKVRDKPAST